MQPPQEKSFARAPSPASAFNKADGAIEFEMNGETYRVRDAAAFAALIATATTLQPATDAASRRTHRQPRRSLSELRRRRSITEKSCSEGIQSNGIDAHCNAQIS